MLAPDIILVLNNFPKYMNRKVEKLNFTDYFLLLTILPHSQFAETSLLVPVPDHSSVWRYYGLIMKLEMDSFLFWSAMQVIAVILGYNFTFRTIVLSCLQRSILILSFHIFTHCTSHYFICFINEKISDFVSCVVNV